MKAEPIGLYIHIPFCIKKCKYCDFTSFPHMSEWEMESYVGRLCEEIEGYRRDDKIPVNTIFFGGGTPSLLPPLLFKRVINKIRDVFEISDDAEFTVEVNPGTVKGETLDAYRALGVNRISIGLQSIHENELKKIGRIHSYRDFITALDIILERDFSNISVDLMYARPEQSARSFKKTLECVAALPITHVSVYGLILEEGTPFYEERDTLNLPSEEQELEMYELASEILGRSGFEHYEISNYARDGAQCRHNLKYWREEEYIGCGIAAYSYFEGKRYGNSKSWQEYSEGFGKEYSYTEIIDIDAEKYEYVMLGLRLSRGISLSEYQRRFSEDFTKGREALLDKLESAGYIKRTSDTISLTERGFYVSNSIITEIL